jgi:hypothetical protein
VANWEDYPWLSDRAAELLGRFAGFVRALDDGELAKAAHEQREMRRLGCDVAVRPLDEPGAPRPRRDKAPRPKLAVVGEGAP